MKRLIALVLTVATILFATPAFAEAPEQGDDTCVPWSGQEYIAPTYETVIVTEAWVEVIEHPAVTEEYTVWIYKKYTPGQGWRYKEFPQTAKPADPGNGWIFYQKEIRARVLTEAWTELIQHEATFADVLVDPGQEYIPPVVCEDEPIDPTTPPTPPVTTPEPTVTPIVTPIAPPAAPVPQAPKFTG